MVLPYSRFSRKDEVLTHGVFFLPPACEYPGWLLMLLEKIQQCMQVCHRMRRAARDEQVHRQ
jgi:hypothetical protein